MGRLDSASLEPPSAMYRRVPSETERRMALALQLLQRYGVLTREAVHAEGIAGGFSSVYEALKALEERGRVRRGYFVAGLGATQFALPGANERLRALRDPVDGDHTLVLAATDPANAYGAALPWPTSGIGKSEIPNPDSEPGDSVAPAAANVAARSRPQRVAGAQVVLRDGALLAWLPRTERHLLTFLPEAEPGRTHAATALAEALADLVEAGRRRAMLVALVDGEPVERSFLGRFLIAAGFTGSSRGYLKRRQQLWPTGIRERR